MDIDTKYSATKGENRGKKRRGKDTKVLIEKALHALCKPTDFDSPIDCDPEFLGMTRYEVMVLQQVRYAVQGYGKAFDRVIDRLDGKPTQSIEETQVNMSYQEFLDTLDDEDDFAPLEEAPENRITTIIPPMSPTTPEMEN